MNNHTNDVVLVPSVPTPPAAMISSESQKSAARWAASFVVASLVGAYFLWMIL